MKQTQNFQGFPTEAIKFLHDISRNNNKTWFEEHKQRYQDFLVTPLKNLVTDLGDFMLVIDPYLEVRPAVNKTISKIHRDTRFSTDKSPFKDRMWLTFKRPNKNWKDAPAFFFEITPNAYRYGMGLYAASPQTMSFFRKAIDENLKAFLKSISFYSKQSRFIVEGEEYKRKLKSDHPANVQEWYQKRNFYLVCNRNMDDRISSPDLLDDLASGFNELAPFYNYIWDIRHKA